MDEQISSVTYTPDGAVFEVGLAIAPPDETIRLINAERAKAGVAPLRADPAVSAFACAWAGAMNDFGKLSHGGFAGRASCAFPGRAAAENVAWGQPTPAAVVAAWMGSAGHRANMLNPAYATAGVARAGKYWCLDLLG